MSLGHWLNRYTLDNSRGLGGMGTVALSSLLTTGTKTTFLAGGDSIVTMVL